MKYADQPGSVVLYHLRFSSASNPIVMLKKRQCLSSSHHRLLCSSCSTPVKREEDLCAAQCGLQYSVQVLVKGPGGVVARPVVFLTVCIREEVSAEHRQIISAELLSNCVEIVR